MWFAGLADWVRAAADLGPPPSPNGKNSSIHSLGPLSGWGMEETMPVIYVRGQEVPNKRCKTHLSDRFSLGQVKSLLITPQQAAQKPNSGNNGAPASSGFSQSQVFSAIAAEHREVPWTTASIFSGYHGNTPPPKNATPLWQETVALAPHLGLWRISSRLQVPECPPERIAVKRSPPELHPHVCGTLLSMLFSGTLSSEKWAESIQ